MVRAAVATFVAVGASLAGLASGSEADLTRAAELVERGDRLFRKTRFEKALVVYERANEVGGKPVPQALLGVARCHERLENLDLALEAARSVVALDPSGRVLFRAQVLRGSAAYKLAVGGQVDSAVQALYQALATKAGAESEQDELLLEAKEAFEGALKHSRGKRNRALRSRLADVLVRLGEAEAATELVEANRALESKQAEPRVGAAPGSGELQPASKLFYPPAQYTEIARKARIEGVVVLELSIDEFGGVEHARVVNGLPMGLDQAAVEAVMKWSFAPALLDGRPVATTQEVQVRFALQ